MNLTKFAWAALLITLGLSGAAWADPVTDGARAVIAAHESGDTVRLRVLAQLATPDPWLVAEELLAGGHTAAAIALAGATDAVDVRGLRAYVLRQRDDIGSADRAGHEQVQARLAAAGRSLEAGRADEALATLASVDTGALDVPSAVTLFARGAATRQTGAPAEGALEAAASTAEKIGWWAMAWRARIAALDDTLGRGNLARTAVHAQAARKIATKRERPGDIASCDEQLATLAARRGDADRALTHLDQAVHGYRLSGDSPRRAGCHIAAGDLHIRAAAYDAANDRYGKGLGLARKARDAGLEARARRGLGIVLARLGNYAAAERELNRALTLAVRAKLDGVRGDVLANLGVVLLGRGQYSRALAAGQGGLRLHQERGDTAGIAAALMNLGLTHASLGKCEVAGRYLTQAQAAYVAMGDVVGEGRALTNLGIVHGTLGDLDKALACQEAAFALCQRTGDAAGQALALGRLGHVYGQRGDYTRAISLQHRAIQVKRTQRDRLGEAISLETIGQLQQQLGNYAKAMARRGESLYLARGMGAADLIARNRWGLAEIALMTANPELALTEARAAVEALPAYARGLFDEQGALARERWAGVYDVGMSAAAMLDDVPAFAWFLERQRAATLLESLGGREALMTAAVPEALRTAEADAREAETWALQRVRDASDQGQRGPLRKARKSLVEARHQLREARERITREASGAARIVYPKPLDARRLRQVTKPGDALVLYALLPDRAYALVATTRGVVLRTLGSSRTLVEALHGLDDQGEGTWTPDFRERLKSLLITPLGLDPKRTKRIFISPDGALCSVPFGLLVDARSVTYVPSATTYGWLYRARKKTGAGKGVLALGRPDYGMRDVVAPPDSSGVQRGVVRKSHPAGALPPLEGSAVEVNAIGDVVLLDGQATEDALRASLLARERWRAVHLACHGLVDYEHPLFSALALTPNKYGDGLLTTLDVFGMDVPADLVVLSACETGRGRLLRTEGVFGFTRAFLFAGASRVVVSLWKVDDEATRELMVKFYELWGDGGRGKGTLPASRALRAAQAHVRAQPKWADPYYWAAWQLWGLAD